MPLSGDQRRRPLEEDDPDSSAREGDARQNQCDKRGPGRISVNDDDRFRQRFLAQGHGGGRLALSKNGSLTCRYAGYLSTKVPRNAFSGRKKKVSDASVLPFLCCSRCRAGCGPDMCPDELLQAGPVGSAGSEFLKSAVIHCFVVQKRSLFERAARSRRHPAWLTVTFLLLEAEDLSAA